MKQKSFAAAVKRDMERARPMDRLVVGDVGYGKTEVAMRAAMRDARCSSRASAPITA